jgi:hypothetical protein
MVARFLFQSGHFSSKNKRIRPNAFLPIDGGTSIFLIRGLTEKEIWECGKVAGQNRDQIPLARGDLLIEDIEKIQLVIDIDNKPKNHGNILNWPPTKDEQIAKAQELSRVVANFALNPK